MTIEQNINMEKFSKNADKIRSMSREQVDTYADVLCVCITAMSTFALVAANAIKDEVVGDMNPISLFELAEILEKFAKDSLLAVGD